MLCLDGDQCVPSNPFQLEFYMDPYFALDFRLYPPNIFTYVLLSALSLDPLKLTSAPKSRILYFPSRLLQRKPISPIENPPLKIDHSDPS